MNARENNTDFAALLLHHIYGYEQHHASFQRGFNRGAPQVSLPVLDSCVCESHTANMSHNVACSATSYCQLGTTNFPQQVHCKGEALKVHFSGKVPSGLML